MQKPILPYSITSENIGIHDILNNTNIVIFHLSGTLSSLDSRYIEDSKYIGSTLSPIIDDKWLIFIYKYGNIIDEQTNSIWVLLDIVYQVN